VSAATEEKQRGANLTCHTCKHEWQQHLVDPEKLPLVIAAFVREMRKVTCPKCEAGFRSLRIKVGK
jgi:hypothetical protein